VSPKSKEGRRIESREQNNYSLFFFPKNSSSSCREAIECRRLLEAFEPFLHFDQPAHSNSELLIPTLSARWVGAGPGGGGRGVENSEECKYVTAALSG